MPRLIRIPCLFFVVIPVALLLFGGCSLFQPGEEIEVGPPTEPPREVDVEPAWSPDGKWIAYTHVAQSEEERIKGGQYQVWVMDVGTKARRFVTEGSLPTGDPTSRRLAFVRQSNIFTVELTTGREQQLTTWGECFYPAWSPDGKRIAFDTSHGDPKGASAIWLMDIDGGNKLDISRHGEGEWRAPSWSPDGRLVHFRYISEVGSEIFTMDSTGNDAVRLTKDSTMDYEPVWSRDGEWIAWSKWEEGLNHPRNGIWLMRSDGSDQHQLTRRPDSRVSFAFSPSFSPDGRRLVYAGYNDDSHTYNLWLVNTDGTGDRPLTVPEEDDP